MSKRESSAGASLSEQSRSSQVDENQKREILLRPGEVDPLLGYMLC